MNNLTHGEAQHLGCGLVLIGSQGCLVPLLAYWLGLWVVGLFITLDLIAVIYMSIFIFRKARKEQDDITQ
jgi:uncharacterized membrane protein